MKLKVSFDSTDEVCRPKSLKMRRNEDVNKTSITKLGWRIFMDNDSIWVIIMRDKYIYIYILKTIIFSKF